MKGGNFELMVRNLLLARITNPREQEIQFFVDYTVRDYKLVDYEDNKIGCSFYIEFQDVFGD